MNRITTLIGKLEILLTSILFLKNHWLALLSLGLIAAFGRVIQLGGFGEISATAYIALEVIIEMSRILIFVYVLGVANIKRGLHHIVRIFSGKTNFRVNYLVALQKIKNQWVAVCLSFIGFLMIAGTINLLIDQLAYQTCLYLSLKQGGILVSASSEWTILLFFKNISVIPFTLVFETLFLLWITNKLAKKESSVNLVEGFNQP
jgi:hypothetical protein